MNNLLDEKTTQVYFKDNYGKIYSYNDLLNMSFEQLDALEKGQPVNITPNLGILDNSKAREKAKVKTLGLHPQFKRSIKGVKNTVITLILATGLFLSGYLALHFHLLI